MSAEPEIYVGLMSGTSMDSMDCCAVQIDDKGRMQVLRCLSKAWPPHIRAGLHALCRPGGNEIDHAGVSSNAVGAFSALTVRELLKDAGIEPSQVRAVGSHGQTVRHRPERGFTVQLDNAPLCALLSHIDVWSDFRRQDVAAGGEGAPLTPLFHQKLFASDDEPRYILNLGGIANLTVLRPGGELFGGWDVGPANTLLDLASRELLQRSCDEDGRTARQGQVRPAWLQALMADPFFKKLPPKSCGRELFCRDYIAKLLKQLPLDPQWIPDVFATLTAFTVQSVVTAFKFLQTDPRLPSGGTVILCGGGVANLFMREELERALRPFGLRVLASDAFGVDPYFLEAQAFAYFAYLSSHGQCVDLSKVTGSKRQVIMGSLSPAPDGFFVRGRMQN